MKTLIVLADDSHVRSVYEQAIKEIGTKVECEDIWLDYVQYELGNLNMDKASDIYWRAKSTSNRPTMFLQKLQQAINDK